MERATCMDFSYAKAQATIMMQAQVQQVHPKGAQTKPSSALDRMSFPDAHSTRYESAAEAEAEPCVWVLRYHRGREQALSQHKGDRRKVECACSRRIRCAHALLTHVRL
eukprot:1151234-Pelagomonas_calceolata.AAC.1